MNEQNWESGNKPLSLQSVDFWQGCQDHKIEKEQSFQQIVQRKLNNMQNNKFETYLIKCTKIKSKWIKEWNIRSKAIKLGKVYVNLWPWIRKVF